MKHGGGGITLSFTLGLFVASLTNALDTGNFWETHM